MSWDPFGYYRFLSELQVVTAKVEIIIEQQLQELAIMTALSDAIAKLQADVTDESSAVDSAVTLLHGLKAQLDAAIAASQPVDPKPLTDLAAEIEAKTAVLAAAVAANTVADPTPPTP